MGHFFWIFSDIVNDTFNSSQINTEFHQTYEFRSGDSDNDSDDDSDDEIDTHHNAWVKKIFMANENALCVS